MISDELQPFMKYTWRETKKSITRKQFTNWRRRLSE